MGIMSHAQQPAPPQITGFGYVRPLGAGGFADVYQYEQDMPRRVVAVKVLQAPITAPRDRSDFESEADAMARLSSHPSIVSVFSAGVASDGRPYLAMEFCPGSMRERTRGNPATIDVVLDAGVRLAGALETAHRAGILHRDIKPSNVLLNALGRPVLTDFGIALPTGRTGSAAQQQALSVPWAAPEVIAGETSGTVASEVWSLGATLYTFAVGFSPFEHSDRSLNTQKKMSARIVQARYPRIESPGYEPLNEVLARAMSGRPEARFASMAEFAEALRALQRGYGLEATAFDVVQPGLVTPAAHPSEVRGPTVSSVRTTSRAQRRAELASARRHDASEGIVTPEAKPSALRPALIGVGSALLVMAIAAAIWAWLGWGT